MMHLFSLSILFVSFIETIQFVPNAAFAASPESMQTYPADEVSIDIVPDVDLEGVDVLDDCDAVDETEATLYAGKVFVTTEKTDDIDNSTTNLPSSTTAPALAPSDDTLVLPVAPSAENAPHTENVLSHNEDISECMICAGEAQHLIYRDRPSRSGRRIRTHFQMKEDLDFLEGLLGTKNHMWSLVEEDNGATNSSTSKKSSILTDRISDGREIHAPNNYECATSFTIRKITKKSSLEFYTDFSIPSAISVLKMQD